MSKRIFVSFIAFFVSLCASAYDFDRQTVQDLYSFRKSVFLAEPGFDFSGCIDSFQVSQNEKHLGVQERFVVDSEILLQRMNLLEDSEKRRHTVLDMLSLQKKIAEFIKNTQDVSEYLYVSCADLQSRLISNLSGGEMYRLSMDSRRMYEKAISLNGNFAPAYSGYGSWLYFAPSVAGGGLNSALKQFSRAVKFSDEKMDLYMNLIYRSQVHLRLGNKKAYEKDLAAAEKVFENEYLIQEIRRKNEKGKYFFD